MKCGNCRKSLPALMAGELAPAAVGTLERHLAACPDCAGLRAGFEADRALLHELPEPEPGPGLVTRVMAEVRAGRQERGWRLPALHGLRVGLTAAALALFVAGGAWVGTDLAGRADLELDPLAVNGMPALTDYVDATLGSEL
ncbi:MAG: zf-HC2 domain-containing protein [bacterium]